jgi:GT2 family glycosyltransferase
MEEEIDEGLPRVLTVVVTHEGRPWLRESLSSLAAQDYPALDVFVFDNASTRSSKALVTKVLPHAEFHRSDSNLGYGAAANRALELSGTAPDCDYYLFLHDDSALEPDCVSKLVLAALETSAGAVGGKGLAWNGSGVLVEAGMSADQFGYPFTGLEEGEIDQGQHDERREVLYVTSACILVSRSLVERTGSWDSGFFVFGEDLDLCIRGRLAGYPIIFEPDARFRHVAALSNRVREARSIKDTRFYTRRNRLRTILKNLSVVRTVLLLPIYLAVMTAEVVLLIALRRFDEIGAYPKAIVSFLGSVPDVLRRRRAVQRRRGIPDRRLRRLMVSDLHRARIFLERRRRPLSSERWPSPGSRRRLSVLASSGWWAARPLPSTRPSRSS